MFNWQKFKHCLLDVFLIDCILTVPTTHKSKKWVGWTVKIKTPQNIMR
ncbi:hypothetical protein [uncultured Gammaproteobacteria bacterium]|nr:hypothetical protein [uncultured Gammaproteobacteria bacterium]CAC9645870.1 hypothetical protein [uncultured Gammaproteobacteria bacterium]